MEDGGKLLFTSVDWYNNDYIDGLTSYIEMISEDVEKGDAWDSTNTKQHGLIILLLWIIIIIHVINL